MTYTRINLARHLREELDRGYDPERIGSALFEVQLDLGAGVDSTLYDLVYVLAFMGEGPEYEVSEPALRRIILALEDVSQPIPSIQP